MKTSLMALVALLSLSTAASMRAAQGSPVEKVVELLTTLKAQTEHDGKVEQQIYDKYACWCEKTSKRKADDIVAAQAELRTLGQTILKLKGKIATLAAEIEELTEKIKKNKAEQEELTAVRQKENAAFMAESTETKEALDALQQAIIVLAKATTPKKGAELIQEAEKLREQQAIRSVFQALPSKTGLPPSRMSLLSDFMSGKARYAPQSATIQGILVDMYSTFSTDLQDSTLDEANKNHDYEKLYASIEKENNEMEESIARKKEQKADAESILADTTATYDEVEDQMKADMEFFDQTKKACEAKHEEWDERKKLRSEELEGIEKAIEILSSDDARELFDKSIKPGLDTVFLQVASTPSLLQDATSITNRAYNVLKEKIKKSHSVRLAALAVQIRTAKYGHFEKVIKAIDEMLVTLREEGAADLAKKTQCDDEFQKIAMTVEDLDWKIKNNKAKIAKLTEIIKLREKEKEETIEKIEETKEYMEKITEERKAENEEFLAAKKDDEAAIVLLEQAKKVLMKYYKKNDIKMGPIQGSVKLMQEDPVFAISEDQAPDATFSKKGHRKNESKDIVSLMTYIIQDLENEIKNEVAAEEKAQAEYEEEMATAQKLVDTLEDKKVHLEEVIAKRKDDKKDEEHDMKENDEDRDEELAYKAKIKPDCDWILKAFDERAVARAAEMDGLTAAKEYLAGQVTLVEKSKNFDDSRLSKIGFLGISH
jgi:hypothetical protein